MACINTNTPEFQVLKNKSGIDEKFLRVECSQFFNQHKRLPHLDELSSSRSEPYLRKSLKINEHNGVNIEEMLNDRGVQSVDEAIVNINNDHRDLEVDIMPIEKEAIIDIKERPRVDNFDDDTIDVDNNPDSIQVFNNSLLKLASLYGIDFNAVDSFDLTGEEWNEISPDISTAAAFVYNGDIYINIDNASVDAPLHEMMHIFAGSMRFTEPELYQRLVDSVMNIPDYSRISSQYKNRTRNDVNEELLVSEISKYLTGIPSVIDNLDDNVKYEIFYNVNRTLDSVLMGKDSVKTVDPNILYTLSLKQLSKMVRSTIMTSKFNGNLDLEGSALHRKINNIKSDLLRTKQLEEVCD